MYRERGDWGWGWLVVGRGHSHDEVQLQSLGMGEGSDSLEEAQSHCQQPGKADTGSLVPSPLRLIPRKQEVLKFGVPDFLWGDKEQCKQVGVGGGNPQELWVR